MNNYSWVQPTTSSSLTLQREGKSITQITKIREAYERANNLGTIPKSKLIQAVAQSLGISEEMVIEAMEQEEV